MEQGGVWQTKIETNEKESRVAAAPEAAVNRVVNKVATAARRVAKAAEVVLAVAAAIDDCAGNLPTSIAAAL
jgi:hypothetical protein